MISFSWLNPLSFTSFQYCRCTCPMYWLQKFEALQQSYHIGVQILEFVSPLHSYSLDVLVLCGCTYLDLFQSHLVSYKTFFCIRFVLMIILFMHHAYMYNDNTLILWWEMNLNEVHFSIHTWWPNLLFVCGLQWVCCGNPEQDLRNDASSTTKDRVLIHDEHQTLLTSCSLTWLFAYIDCTTLPSHSEHLHIAHHTTSWSTLSFCHSLIHISLPVTRSIPVSPEGFSTTWRPFCQNRYLVIVSLKRL